MHKQLPKDWKLVKLGDVCLSKITTRNPSISGLGVFNYVDIASIDNKSGTIIEARQMANSEAPSRARKVIQYDDILVSTIRPNLNAVAKVPKYLDDQICSTGFCVLRPNTLQTVPEYIYHLVRSRRFIDTMISLAKGASYPAISDTNILSFNVPLPPLETQYKIASILDEANSLRKLRKQADEKMKELIPALFVDMFGDPLTSSSRWPIKKLEEVCVKITDGAHQTPTYTNEGVPFLRVTDIQSKSINWANVKRIPESEYQEMTKRHKPEIGDILYSKNGTIGIAKLIEWEERFCHFVSLALLKTDKSQLIPKYFETFMNTPLALKQAAEHSKQGTVTNLHLNEIRKIKIPVPPMKLQEEFTGIVQSVEDETASQLIGKEKLDDLFNSLMDRCMSGIL